LHLPPKKIPRLFVKTFFGNKPVSDSDSDSDYLSCLLVLLDLFLKHPLISRLFSQLLTAYYSLISPDLFYFKHYFPLM